MPTDKFGNKLTWKQFMARWKEGIQKVTPFQQIKVSMIGFVIVFVGIVWGLVVTFLTHIWWLFVILIGSGFIASMQFLAILQKYVILSALEKQMKGGSYENAFPKQIA